MAKFETPPEALGANGAQSSAATMELPLSAEQIEAFKATDNKLEEPTNNEQRAQLDRDLPRFEELAAARAKNVEERLARMIAENPDIKIDDQVTPEMIYTPDEIAVMKEEAEAAESHGINWKNVLMGVLVAGGVIAAVWFGGSALGYGPAMLDIASKGLGYAKEGMKYIGGGIDALSQGISSVVENIKSWGIWTELGKWFTEGGVEEGLKGIEGGDLGPDFGKIMPPSPLDPQIGQLPPLP